MPHVYFLFSYRQFCFRNSWSQRIASTVVIDDKTDPDIVEIGACSSQRFYNLAMDSFIKANIPLGNLVDFARDGCNTTMGEPNSVSQRLKETLLSVMIQKCICHSLHLCSSTPCKSLPCMCENRNIYNIYKNSSNWQAELKEFQHFCNVEPHKILRPSQIRWLSLLEVVGRILKQCGKPLNCIL